MDWYAKVEKATNGYVLRTSNQLDDGTPSEDVQVIQCDDAVDEQDQVCNELKAFVTLVWQLQSHLAVPVSKHHRYGLRIDVVKRNADGTDTVVRD